LCSKPAGRIAVIRSINPPANTTETAALIRAELEANGLTPKLFESGPNGQTNLIVRLKGLDASKKPLLLLNHMDVVPVDKKAWKVDPFGGIIRDGQIWGRGALDMKGLGVQQLMALIALHKAGIVPSRDIFMIATSDQETSGARGIQWMIANHYADIDAEYVLDIAELKARINDPRVAVETINVSPDPGVSSTSTPLYAAMRKASSSIILMRS
jgi:acetylornithine deacetylase/succinyl-diaminopimelate desuccinylase-like protein